jgi:pimeloyl-ACP methyl ester carboxylesterase
MFFFQLRFIAEWRVKKNNFALIDRLWRDWSPRLSQQDSAELVGAVKQALARDENLSAALGYYRDLFKPSNFKRAQQLTAQPISVPTLTIAGECDGCIGVEHFPSMKSCFSNEFELLIMQGAGHFMHREQPEEFATAVINFFDQD